MPAGKRVLIVEDEPIVALSLEDLLDELGVVPLGPAPDVARARAILDAEPVDAGVLDVNPGRERSDAVAERLASSDTLFIFATAHGREFVPAHDVEALIRPFRFDQQQGALSGRWRSRPSRPHTTAL